MVIWIIAMTGVTLSGLVIVFKWKQRQAGHIAYWQQQREIERRGGEAASRLPDCQERRHRMDQASVERIDSELSRLPGSQESVGHHASAAGGSAPR
jgi:hypothetical protein